MTKDDLLRAILLEATTASSEDEDEAENAFNRIAELATAALANRQPPEWALAGQPKL